MAGVRLEEIGNLPAYTIEDRYRSEEPLPDAWAKYLAERYVRREALYRGLDESEQELIRNEIRRIKYFREHFRDYRVSPTDRLPLVDLLEDSRTRWRDIAFRASAEELHKCQRDIEKNGETPIRARNRQILRRVQLWPTKPYAALQDAIAPDSYMCDLESGFESREDDPRRPNYGYNGWLIVWDEAHGGVDEDHALVHGRFPHQKISIQQLLYNKTSTPLKRDVARKQFRYFHLPANNMRWVEDAMARYYGEDDVDFDSPQILTAKSNAQKLLRNELWRGQQRGGLNLPPHSRQMASRCSVVDSAPVDRGVELPDTGTRKDITLSMPYLHWEVEKRLYRMAQFAQVARSRKEHTERLRRASTFRRRGRIADIANLESARAARPETAYDDPRDRGPSNWRPQNTLAKYIWNVAKLFQIIDEAADGRLIDDHLYASPPLHMRRTLEQFYYWTADDTSRRDREQVVCQGTRSKLDDPEATSRILMVDQLWLWILDQNTVISFFPRRWGRNKPDPSAVHRGIRDRMGTLNHDEIRSVHDLAFIVIDECSKVFFDRTKPLDHRPDVVDLFGSAISNIAENKTIAYEGFGRDVSKISIDSMETAEQLLRKSLNIGFEWSILVDAQNVIEELQIMQEIFTKQISVIRNLSKATGLQIDESRRSRPSSEVDGDRLLTWARSSERLAGLLSDMEQRRDELASMEMLQTKTRAQLRELLDMKQQQSNIIEAKAAIRRADESVLQGRSIVVFTVVTIFFLPLSFLASVFGMNAPEFSNDGVMPLSRQLTYMFAISAAVIFISLALAFSTWTRTILAVTFSLIYVTLEDWMGWRNKKASYNSTAIKNIQRARMKELDNRATTRRLTEISRRNTDLTAVAATVEAGAAGGSETPRSPTWTLGRVANSGLDRLRTRRQMQDPEAV